MVAMSEDDKDRPGRRRKQIWAAAAVLLAVAAFLGWWNLRDGPETVTGNVEGNRFLLDTVVSVKLFGSDQQQLLDEAFDRIAGYENELSRHQEGSEMSRINAAGESAISADALDVLGIALDYAAASGGAFDPTVGPLVDIWGIGGDNPRIPDETELQEVLKLVDYRKVSVEGDRVRLEVPGMELDLGGVAKGWIADRIAEYLSENGARHILINLGGNVRVAGGKPGGVPFRIGMQDPFDDRGAYLGIFTLSDGSVVSSGVYERFFEADGVRYHHILDTESGYPVQNSLAAVTVLSENSADGDALSTTLFTLGLEDGLAFAEARKDIEAAFVTKDGRVVMTAGAAEIFEPAGDQLTVEVRG